MREISLFLAVAFLVGSGIANGNVTPVEKNKVKLVSVTSLKTDQTGNRYFDLHMDGNVLAKNLKPEFDRNFIQFTLNNTAISTAKIVPTSDSEIQKIFAYAYNPNVARLRIILNKKSDFFKTKLHLKNINSKTLRITLDADTKTDIKSSEGEKKILSEVISKTKEIDLNNPESVKTAIFEQKKEKESAPTTTTASAVLKSSFEKESEVGVKKDPSRGFLRVGLVLFGLVAFILLAAFLFKRYAAFFKKIPFGKKERLIQVVATHYLGGKRSISLVKIAGEFMVIGVSNENISLLSKMSPDKNIDRMLEDRYWGGTFEKHLDSYANDVSVAKEEAPTAIQNTVQNYDGYRDFALSDQVKDKVEVSSFRANLKEKIGSLKPLERS